GNFLPLNQRVERIRDFVEIMSKVEDSDLTPNYSDFIVPIYIQSVIETATCKEFLRLKTFFQNCRFMTGESFYSQCPKAKNCPMVLKDGVYTSHTPDISIFKVSSSWIFSTPLQQRKCFPLNHPPPFLLK
ncbi:hypothetical protein GDO81_025425, partial [Engystomops pustulosus]